MRTFWNFLEPGLPETKGRKNGWIPFNLTSRSSPNRANRRMIGQRVTSAMIEGRNNARTIVPLESHQHLLFVREEG
jgi:hypothetical protein